MATMEVRMDSSQWQAEPARPWVVARRSLLIEFSRLMIKVHSSKRLRSGLGVREQAKGFGPSDLYMRFILSSNALGRGAAAFSPVKNHQFRQGVPVVYWRGVQSQSH
uniref:Uncharacterized protein n=1 Tax=Rhodosorus marinus TaxID=101924 RepID=A0A7S2ZCC1_9RHOD|mmetsp:Transcript_13915/g.56057  ORF Transcript_13915/g.56057 Transcript_13915/m.56057 type:complete len:107 (+) Transcript_13915:1629-1949(+)